MHHLGRLRIPSTLIDHIPAEEKHHLRWRVAWHQYHMLLGVTNLRRELSMPPRNETDNPPPTHATETPWFSKLKARRVTPNPTTKNLKEQYKVQYKVQRKKHKTAQTAPTHTHQQKAQALLARPLTHATKVETIKVLTSMPSTATALHTQLERHLGHRVEDLPIHNEVGHALSQTLEERRNLANTLLQNRKYAGGMHRNLLRLMQCRTHEYTAYKHQVKRLYLTAVRGPCPDRCHDGRPKPYRVCTSESPGLMGTRKPRNTFSSPRRSTPQQHTPPGAGMNGTTTSGTHSTVGGNANENGMKVRSSRKRGRPDD